MENEQSCIENNVEDIVAIKPRLSLFNPYLQSNMSNVQCTGYIILKSINNYFCS